MFCSQGGDHVEGESEGGEASPRENGGSSLALPSENRPSSPQAGDLHSREGHYNSSEDLLDYSHFPVEEGKSKSFACNTASIGLGYFICRTKEITRRIKT